MGLSGALESAFSKRSTLDQAAMVLLRTGQARLGAAGRGQSMAGDGSAAPASSPALVSGPGAFPHQHLSGSWEPRARRPWAGRPEFCLDLPTFWS